MAFSFNRIFRKKISFIGVQHTTREGGGLKGKPTRDLANLALEIKRLKKSGVQAVGVEMLATKKIDRSNPTHRYFLGARLLLERNGIQPIEVDDPPLIRLGETILQYVDEPTPTVSKFLAKKFPNGLGWDGRTVTELRSAIHYARTIAMVRNARKKRLRVVIFGANHAVHLQGKGNQITFLGKPGRNPFGEFQPSEDYQYYKKHKKLIKKLLEETTQKNR